MLKSPFGPRGKTDRSASAMPAPLPPGGQTFTGDGVKFNFLSGSHANFWSRLCSGTWEPETFRAMKENITPQTLYVDIGAWIGPTVLYGASLAKRVVAVEPDPVAMSHLLANLALNEDLFAKTELFNLAIGTESGPLELYAEDFGDSETSLLPSRGGKKITFMSMSFADFLSRLMPKERHVFIKVDVEGAEYSLVPTMCRALLENRVKADLYISVHGKFAVDASTDIGAWSKNFLDHAQLLDSLINYGDVMIYREENWRKIGLPFGKNFAEILEMGGFQTELLVKHRL